MSKLEGVTVLRLFSRPRLVTAARLLLFLVAWAFLDSLFNLRYPGDEPTFWYPLPALDVVVLLALLLVARRRGYEVPDAVRFAIVAVMVAVRIFRCAEGLVERHFHRPLSLYLDLALVPNLVGLLRTTVAPARLIVWALLIVVAVVAVGALTWQAMVVVERSLASKGARRLFVAALIVCAALWPLWSPRHDPHLHHGLFGASVAPRLAREVSFLRHAPDYRRARSEDIARVQRELRALPSRLDHLHGADVLLILVESYGETVIKRPAYVRRMAPVYEAFERAVTEHGFSVASSLLASPTYGGRSWLAHASLATGVRTEDGIAYAVLLDTRPSPLTMAGFFREAGYRTVLVQPGTTQGEGEVVGFMHKYYAQDLAYRGPSFKWATMPDQYVLDFVDRRERENARVAGGARAPVFIEYALVSSHSPWSLQPRVVGDWDRLRDGGRVFDSIEPVRYPVTWSNLEDGGEAYVTSLIYDFEVLRRYLTERVADGALVIILGDHQPSAEVTGDDPSHGVPIHVVSRDRSFVDRFVAAGYLRGMWPRAGQVPPGLETFLAQLLRLFSTPPVAYR